MRYFKSYFDSRNVCQEPSFICSYECTSGNIILWKTRPGGLLTTKLGTKKEAKESYAAFSQVIQMWFRLIYFSRYINYCYSYKLNISRSVFPHHSSAAPTGPCLLMADGRPTKAWGSRTLSLQFGNRRFQFSFLLLDVDRPILGADFLAEFRPSSRCF